MQLLKRYLVPAAAILGLTLTAGVAGAAQYGPGASDTEIKIGNTNPYSGPASSYGTIGKAIAAYWDMVNANGGINGRKINFISLDDGYSPPKTKEQFRRLVEKEKVLFTFQTLGTPTNSAVHKYMNKKMVPHLFVATGATKWGDPENFPWTMGFQPNYQTIGKIFGNYILENHPDGKVGILYQIDDYGKDYVVGLRQALGAKWDAMVVHEESYEVTDPTVNSQIVNLKASGADVFVNISIPKPAAQAIKKIHDIGWKPVHLLNAPTDLTFSLSEAAVFMSRTRRARSITGLDRGAPGSISRSWSGTPNTCCQRIRSLIRRSTVSSSCARTADRVCPNWRETLRNETPCSSRTVARR